ncbi:hypothetical protein A2U01_0027451, partial [Trifolium medium]|nr:hypothetical protein [Trifolium medium]
VEVQAIQHWLMMKKVFHLRQNYLMMMVKNQDIGEDDGDANVGGGGYFDDRQGSFELWKF